MMLTSLKKKISGRKKNVINVSLLPQFTHELQSLCKLFCGSLMIFYKHEVK